MLRIHFLAEDFARTRISTQPDPMWETVLSLQLLQHRRRPALFDGWRRRVHGTLGTSARLLLPLTPPAVYFPDFLTPSDGTTGLEESIAAVLSTPVTRMRAELELLAGQRRLPAWTADLVGRDTTALAHLGAAFRSYHAAALEPFWSSIQAHVEADRSRRSRTFVDGGVEGMLAGFAPTLRWRPPVLECDYPLERDLHLNGRGLLLIPAFFCLRRPVTLADSGLRPVLVYPIDHGIAPAAEEPGGVRPDDRALVALLGRTRAAVLRAIETGGSTTEISRRAGTSVASASQHATLLRNAGLITTRRHGGMVLHSLTPLGAALLTGQRE